MYELCLKKLVEQSWTVRDGTRQELDPKTLGFTKEATARWKEFHDKVEGKLRKDGDYYPIKGLANKLPEHASRIAGVLTLIAESSADEIGLEEFESGIELAKHYAKEALRLRNARPTNPIIRDAERLLHWLHHSWDERHISVREITRVGPAGIRDKILAERAVKCLEEHRWLVMAGPGATVRGVKPHSAWEIVTNADF